MVLMMMCWQFVAAAMLSSRFEERERDGVERDVRDRENEDGEGRRSALGSLG